MASRLLPPRSGLERSDFVHWHKAKYPNSRYSDAMRRGADIAPDMAEQGGLIGYGPPLPPLYRQAARLVVRIFRGARPQDVPVELPTEYDLVVNLKTAKARSS
jgi:hypothetical protein